MKELKGTKEGSTMKKTKVVDKVIKKAAYRMAEISANQVCTYFFYQPKLPESVKKLRKF